MPLKILEQSDKMFKFVILRVLYNIDIGLSESSGDLERLGRLLSLITKTELIGG